jgi:hypothetical protein
MNYDRYTKDAKNSALFNGNMTSMGGNGAPDPKYTGFRSNTGTIKSAGGGGCVTDGPFKEFVFPYPIRQRPCLDLLTSLTVIWPTSDPALQ